VVTASNCPHLDEPCPWEQPGAVRRDCTPHRGDLLRRLAGLLLICAALSFCTCLPALAVLPCAVAAYVIARRDLAAMDAGLMDPEGWNHTDQARIWAADAAWVSLMPFLVITAIVFFRMVV
jgi:hypothetical protein